MEEESYLGKEVIGTINGYDPIEIHKLKFWLAAMEQEGANHVVCQSNIQAYNIASDKQILKDNIDRYRAMLNKMIEEYRKM